MANIEKKKRYKKYRNSNNSQIQIDHKNEYEVKKDLYEYSKYKLNSLMERKRHIETKSLYVLQASAVLVTLYTALMGRIGSKNNIIIIIETVFYILILLSILLLLASLDDTIVSWFKHKKDKNKNNNVDKSEVKDEDSSNYLDTPEVKDIEYTLKGNYDLLRYYTLMTNAFVKSNNSGDVIAIMKVKYFHYGLRLFIGAVIMLSIIGIILA